MSSALRRQIVCNLTSCSGTPLCSYDPAIHPRPWNPMALLLCSILGIASISVAKPLSILVTDPTLMPTTESLSPFPLSSNTSINAINSTLDLSSPHPICWDQSEGVDLNGDQCKEALVNGDFARLPPNDVLTFEPRSSQPLAGHIGLPRRYHSCMYIGAPNLVTKGVNQESMLNLAQLMANARLNLPFGWACQALRVLQRPSMKLPTDLFPNV